MKNLLLIALLLAAPLMKAQIPVIGTDSLIEIGTWNTEWFGDTENGPSNETTQYDNVKAVLEQTRIDIWGLAEISNTQTWNILTSQLNTRYLSYISTYNQAQKTAFLYDKNLFQIIPSLSGPVLTESQYSYNFAGRPPLRVALATKNRSITDTVYFFVIHMKAYGDQESYNRRSGASQMLKTYLDANYNGKRWVVCGDWNDDLYTSTYSNSPSPYLNFSDTSKYVFISRELTDAGKFSYGVNSGRMLDHILISATMKDWYKTKSARVLNELKNVISGYNNNTSDHYPVLGLFDNRIQPQDTVITGLQKEVTDHHLLIYPNPASNKVFIQAETEIKHIEIYSVTGAMVYKDEINNTSAVINLPLYMVEGIYFLKVFSPGSVSVKRIFVEQY